MSSDPRPGPGPVDEPLLERARCHEAAGDPHAVVAVLAEPMARAATHPLTPHTVEAAVRYAAALAATGLPDPALAWATWAYRAGQNLYPATDERALPPVQTYAAVLTATGHPDRAVTVLRDLVHMLTTLDGPATERTLHACATLAGALHRAGLCPVAHAALTEAWTQWCAHHDRRDPAAIRMLLQLANMYRDCGQPEHANRRLVDAYRAAATDPHHTAAVAAAAHAPADPGHAAVCTHTPEPVRTHHPSWTKS